ncbi:MAG: VTT domain-containing protein [Chloroflexi bacterium]|nr:VTT domain-containing protein [Chloroflexota bacterium]
MDGYTAFFSNAIATLGQGNLVALGALAAVLVLGEAGIPFPFVVQGTLVFIGYQVVQGTVSLPDIIPVAFVLVMGRQVGASVLYWLIRLTGNRLTAFIQKRVPRIGSIERVRAKIGRRTPFAVAAGRMTPGMLVPTTVASGALHMPFPGFALGVVLHTIAWDSVLAGVGVAFGQGTSYLHVPVLRWLTIGLACGMAALAVWFSFSRRLRRAKVSQTPELEKAQPH